MKKSIILTSLLALTACGGGGGGGGGSEGYSSHSVSAPIVTIQGFSGGQTVNQNNTSLTNMASYTNSYTTDEATSKTAMINYVNEKLSAAGLRSNGSTRAGMRAASRASMAPRGTRDDTEFANADAVLTRMKQVIHDLVVKSGDITELTSYITKYKHYIIEALVVAGSDLGDDAENATVEDVITAFNTFKHDHGITSSTTMDDLMAFMDNFDETNFGIIKERMENITLKNSGQEAYFKFKLDETGKIVNVSLWENGTDEFESYWPETAISINNEGHAVAGHSDDPFAPNFKLSDEGWFKRVGNGTGFSSTIYEYKFNLGNHSITANDASLLVEPDEFSEVSIYTDKNYSEMSSEDAIADIKEKLKDFIVYRTNKILHSQHGSTDTIPTAIAAVADYYVGLIDGLTANDIPDNFDTIAANVTMTGMGRGFGADGNKKLTYSDFGYAKLVKSKVDGNGHVVLDGEGNPLSQTLYSTYAGGYDSRRLADSDTDTAVNNTLNGLTFTGTAIAAIEKNVGDDDKSDIFVRDDTAVLSYTVNGNKAIHELRMNNLRDTDTTHAKRDWYKMVVTGTHDFDNEANSSLKFTFDETGKNIDPNYKFFGTVASDPVVATDGSPISVPMNGDTTQIGENYAIHGSAVAQYYGDSATEPTEATGRFSFGERYHNGGDDEELSVYGAFGGTKDTPTEP